MKAITLWQPWASLLACGAKKYETRSWATSYRGPIAIHAATARPSIVLRKVFPLLGEWGYALDYDAKRKFLQAIADAFEDYAPIEDPLSFIEELPLGSVIATAELVGCYPIDAERLGTLPIIVRANSKHHRTPVYTDTPEYLFGDFTKGRYAWEFANMQMLPGPVPAKGKQRLWEWKQPSD